MVGAGKLPIIGRRKTVIPNRQNPVTQERRWAAATDTQLLMRVLIAIFSLSDVFLTGRQLLVSLSVVEFVHRVCQHLFDINLTPLMDITASTHTVIPQTLPYRHPEHPRGSLYSCTTPLCVTVVTQGGTEGRTGRDKTRLALHTCVSSRGSIDQLPWVNIDQTFLNTQPLPSILCHPSLCHLRPYI